jgi:hypothetical protein
MRRWFVLVAALLSVTLLGATATVAQDDSSDAANHPLVGSWVLDLGEDGGRLFTFAADGTALFTDIDGTNGHGSWEATDERSARFTILSLSAARDPRIEDNFIFEGYFLITGDVEVEADGTTWTGDLAIAGLDRANTVQFVDGSFLVTDVRAPMVPAEQLEMGATIAGLPTAGTPAP